jgi:hypothetical protein
MCRSRSLIICVPSIFKDQRLQGGKLVENLMFLRFAQPPVSKADYHVPVDGTDLLGGAAVGGARLGRAERLPTVPDHPGG